MFQIVRWSGRSPSPASPLPSIQKPPKTNDEKSNGVSHEALENEKNDSGPRKGANEARIERKGTKVKKGDEKMERETEGEKREKKRKRAEPKKKSAHENEAETGDKIAEDETERMTGAENGAKKTVTKPTKVFQPEFEPEVSNGEAEVEIRGKNSKKSKKKRHEKLAVSEEKRDRSEATVLKESDNKGFPSSVKHNADASEGEYQITGNGSLNPEPNLGSGLLRANDSGAKGLESSIEREQETRSQSALRETKQAQIAPPPVLAWIRESVEVREEDDALNLDSVPFLDDRLKRALVEKFKISSLFAVQSATWHFLIGPSEHGLRDIQSGTPPSFPSSPLSPCHDLCVCSPTGSGKTLAFALPIAQSLLVSSPPSPLVSSSPLRSSRSLIPPLRDTERRGEKAREERGTFLRALVVVPSRDLAVQVHSVFSLLLTFSPLRVGVVMGQTSKEEEEEKILFREKSRDGTGGSRTRGRIDILIATPGRLTEHIQNTEGFDLSHLKFLVVDETDRLLRQSYQQWYPLTLKAIYEPRAEFRSRIFASHNAHFREFEHDPPSNFSHRDLSLAVSLLSPASSTPQLPPSLFSSSSFSPLSSLFVSHSASLHPDVTFSGENNRVVKICFSATFSRDPSKISSLALHNPRFISVRAREGETRGKRERRETEEKRSTFPALAFMNVAGSEVGAASGRGDVDVAGGFSADVAMIPASVDKEYVANPYARFQLSPLLKEFKVVCNLGEKPLFLAALLLRLHSKFETDPGGTKHSIVFTASVQSTHRLFLLVRQLFQLFFSQDGKKSLSSFVPVWEYSSLQKQRERSKSLSLFQQHPHGVLIASDAMTRGMDIADVAHVISYDCPTHAKTYVHRVGRTARAGGEGESFAILRKEEVKFFKGILHKIENKYCKDFKIVRSEIDALSPFYEQALNFLKERVQEETKSVTSSKAHAQHYSGNTPDNTHQSVSSAESLAMPSCSNFDENSLQFHFEQQP